MIIKALGGCCSRSTKNYERAVEAVAKMKCDCQVELISDPKEIARLGCLATPGLAIDDKVVVSGRLLSVDQMVELFLAHGCKDKEETCCCCCDDECDCEDTCDCDDEGDGDSGDGDAGGDGE
jgi:hypothetical protein